MLQNIDWDKITTEEAQDIANILACAFDIKAKCWGNEQELEIAYLLVKKSDSLNDTSRKGK